jgi:hypothetical protein
MRHRGVQPWGQSIRLGALALTFRLFVRNIAIVSDFAQTGGRRIGFNQFGLAEDAIIAVRLDPGLLPSLHARGPHA